MFLICNTTIPQFSSDDGISIKEHATGEYLENVNDKRSCILQKIPKKSIIKIAFILKREAENKVKEKLIIDAIFCIK